MKLTRVKEIEEAARRIIAMGAESVVIKGGHRKGPAIDLFFDGKKIRTLRSPHTHSPHPWHGLHFLRCHCRLSCQREKIEDAVVLAKTYITQAIRKGFAVGSGHSPVHHFHRFWKN